MAKDGRPAVFLDRDGTVTIEKNYITDPGDIELIPGAAGAIARLRAAGFAVVIVSNQSGVARGYMTEEDMAAVHRATEARLLEAGAALDGAYYCPNLEDGTIERFARDVSCRKPATGMIDAAVRDLDLDMSASFMVGDQITDLEVASRAGIPGVLVATGKGEQTMLDAVAGRVEISYFASDLDAAADWIIETAGVPRGDADE